MTHIPPTVGRIVLFQAGADDGIAATDGSSLAAVIAGVNADGTLNLAVFGQNATINPRLNVPLVQQGEQAVATGYAHWMDYQLGQAAKTEAAEAALAAATTEPAETEPAATTEETQA